MTMTAQQLTMSDEEIQPLIDTLLTQVGVSVNTTSACLVLNFDLSVCNDSLLKKENQHTNQHPNQETSVVMKLKAQAEAHSSPRLMSKHMQKHIFTLFPHQPW